MAILFLDSSGIVKRDISETGSIWVQSLTDPASANECFVAQNPLLITADRELTTTARAEGLAVDDPNSH